MKKVILVFSYYGIGGAQRRAVNIANYLISRGMNVSVVALYGSDGSFNDPNFYGLDNNAELILLPDHIKNDCYAAKIINSEKRKLKLFRKFFNFIPNKTVHRKINEIKYRMNLYSYLVNNNNSVVICFGFNIYAHVYFAAKKSRSKILYAETNASSKYKFDDNYSFVKNLIKKADAFIFQTKDQMLEHGMAESDNVTIIHNPVKNDLPQPYTGERKKVITNFSALKRQKNFLLLIKAFELLLKDYPEYRLELYCDTPSDHGGDYYKELSEYILANGLDDRVSMLYMRKDIHQIIRDYSMFVISSDYEGISNSMIEAMSIGLPVISTDHDGGGAREIITDRNNGLIVPKNDVHSLYLSMKEYIDDPGFANFCGENAAKIRNDLSGTVIFSQWYDFIKRFCI